MSGPDSIGPLTVNSIPLFELARGLWVTGAPFGVCGLGVVYSRGYPRIGSYRVPTWRFPGQRRAAPGRGRIQG